MLSRGELQNRRPILQSKWKHRIKALKMQVTQCNALLCHGGVENYLRMGYAGWDPCTNRRTWVYNRASSISSIQKWVHSATSSSSAVILRLRPARLRIRGRISQSALGLYHLTPYHRQLNLLSIHIWTSRSCQSRRIRGVRHGKSCGSSPLQHHPDGSSHLSHWLFSLVTYCKGWLGARMEP